MTALHNIFIHIHVYLGIGTGITIDSAINTNPKDLASRDAIDRNAPNPRLCTCYMSILIHTYTDQ